MYANQNILTPIFRLLSAAINSVDYYEVSKPKGIALVKTIYGNYDYVLVVSCFDAGPQLKEDEKTRRRPANFRVALIHDDVNGNSRNRVIFQ